MNPSPIRWGETFPHPDSLRTGDILFPRAPSHVRVAIGVAPDPDAELRAFLAAQGVDPSERVEHLLKTGALPGAQAPQEVEPEGESFDVTSPANFPVLLRLLKASFGDLVSDWFGLSVEQFLRHPLRRLLLSALSQGGSGLGFFVGHCALVIRETLGTSDDTGRVYVIEANITDYSHYRVSIHPYYRAEDPAPGGWNAPAGMSGWVNYRASRGDLAWAGRPRGLGRSGAARQDMRQAILAQSKTMLGTPYGFFDSPSLGDANRLYCSEFVLETMRRADPSGELAKSLEDRRSWRWLLDSLERSTRDSLVADLKAGDASLYRRVIEQPFFLMTVHMLWRSAGLEPLFEPSGEGPYA